ncbi:UNVERIFIED_CONTAM: E3 ubiquitin-protein ligase HUWE1 [Trichonephila clavipes]
MRLLYLAEGEVEITISCVDTLTSLNSKNEQGQFLSYSGKHKCFKITSWGGKENGFGLAECCQNLPINIDIMEYQVIFCIILENHNIYMDNLMLVFVALMEDMQRLVFSETSLSVLLESLESVIKTTPFNNFQDGKYLWFLYPASASTLHFEYYAESGEEKTFKRTSNAIIAIHIDNVDQIPGKTPSQIMEELVEKFAVPEDKQMQLFTHIRLAYSFSCYSKRILCVQARLQALSVLAYKGSDIGLPPVMPEINKCS